MEPEGGRTGTRRDGSGPRAGECGLEPPESRGASTRAAEGPAAGAPTAGREGECHNLPENCESASTETRRQAKLEQALDVAWIRPYLKLSC